MRDTGKLMIFNGSKYIDGVVDAKTGIVKRLGYLYREAGDPSLHIIMANMTAFNRFCSNKADFATTGASMQLLASYNSSVGEAIERYDAALSDFHDLIVGSYTELQAKGYALLHPDTFTFFTDSQYGTQGFSYEKPLPSTKLHWIKGNNLIDQNNLYVPACLVFNQFRAAESAICPDIHPGVASGYTYERVVCGSILEIIERDTMMLHWMLSMSAIGIVEDELIAGIKVRFGIPGYLHLSLVYLPNEFGVPCVYSLLYDDNKTAIGAGCSAAFCAADAVCKSICESIQTYYFNRELIQQNSGKIRSFKSRIAPELVDNTQRKKINFTEVLFNLSFYQDSANLVHLKDLMHPKQSVSLSEIENFPLEANSHGLLEALLRFGFTPICVDLTTPDVSDLGWVVYRIFVPGLIPNFPSAFPPLGLGRLYQIGKPREVFEINTTPLPYS